MNDFIKGFHLSLPTALHFKQDVSNVLREGYPYVLMGDITFMQCSKVFGLLYRGKCETNSLVVKHIMTVLPQCLLTSIIAHWQYICGTRIKQVSMKCRHLFYLIYTYAGTYIHTSIYTCIFEIYFYIKLQSLSKTPQRNLLVGRRKLSL